MAKLAVAPEIIMERLLPGIVGRILAVGFDYNGNIILDLEGEGIPKCEQLIAIVHTEVDEKKPQINIRVKLEPRRCP